MKKILVIDDDQGLCRSVVTMILNTFSERVEVLSADSSKTGWDVFLSQQPDIVITDLSMIGWDSTDGAELATRIKEIRPEVKVIIWTAGDVRDIPANCLADLRLHKLQDRNRLFPAIEAWL